MILHLAIIALSTRKRLDRQCPECGRKLVFPPSRINETVLCAKCEARLKAKLGFNRNRESRRSIDSFSARKA